MSCDEAVLRKCGGDIKKQYSHSLLSLASGRQTLGGLPLAFGEGNTKGRILHVLNYKKPGFWVVLIGVITVLVLIIGLMTDPMEKHATIEDYAEQYVQQVIQSYEEVDNLSYDIVDSKITSLDQIASFDSILNQPNSSRDPMGWHNLIFPLEKKHNFCFRSQPKRERTESGVWKAGWMEMEQSITTIRKLIKDWQSIMKGFNPLKMKPSRDG